ncbi:peptidylprolyl isomerase [bacterium]|nr:peptidylprolyl isomerase [bacterium]
MRKVFVAGFMAVFMIQGCASVPTEKSPEKGNVKKMEEAKATITEAAIQTGKGEIVFKFYPKDAPNTVANFTKLAQKGFYDGLTFHRVEPGFVIQGGDPKGDGTGGPGYTINAEFNKQSHITGAVAMARSMDPNSAGSQFYICLGRAPHLDGNYTVFGQVTKGMDVVQAIRVGDSMTKVSVR